MHHQSRFASEATVFPCRRRHARWWLACLLWLTPGLTIISLQAAELSVVRPATLTKMTDKRLLEQLARHGGQPVIINFWATWCAPCREEMPSLQRLANRWRERNVTVITVAVADRIKEVEDVLWELDVTLPVIDDRDRSISRAWDAYALPTTFLLDRQHRVRYKGFGVMDWDSPAIDQKIQTLLN